MLYFNEDHYVGWMPGGKVEIMASDPSLGGVFYFEEPVPGKQPRFAQPESCLGCHSGSPTNYLPGLMGRSNFTNEAGRVVRRVDSHDQSHCRVPISDRWGGWYITGAPAGMQHMANTFTSREGASVSIDPARQFNPDQYLRPDSDILPMLLHDHQVGISQVLMEAQYQVRHTAHYEKEDLESTTREQAERIVKSLLFFNEAPIKQKITGSEDYKRAFAKTRKADRDEKSLKDLHLESRMFQYRCSYMIYSKRFTGLVDPLKSAVLERLKTILEAKKPIKGFEYLGDAERNRILTILEDTGVFP